MSAETSEWLNNNTLIGFTDKRGTAWHYRAASQGDEPNHYPGAVPVEDVKRRLFHWDAISAPVQATYSLPDGSDVEITDESRQVIIRPDTRDVLGIFKSSYSIHQYDEWLMDAPAALLDDGLQIGSAGLLDRGGMAWVQIEMPDNIETPEGEVFRPSLLACTSHNGKLASTFKRIVTRVVCDNTLDCALNEKSASTLKYKHSLYSQVKLGSARDALGIVYSMADEFSENIATLCAQEVTGKQFTTWLDAMVPVPDEDGRPKTMAERKRDEMLALYVNDPRVSPWAGTAWGVVQTANTWQSHFSPIHKGNDRGQRNILAAATGKSFAADEQALNVLRAVLNGAQSAELVNA